MKRYNPKEIEPKWQQTWDEQKTYQADLHSSKPKYIAMSMFNYPSGAGIHIGHAMNYTISDVLARFKRQQGYESYHPVGWDSFGLPAENYAIKAGVSPQESMATIIPSYHKQYKAMGWSNDWSKEISTHDPVYYKWTQWIFSEMYRHGLAYQDARMQWFCEKCQTVLANEQVIDGKCWRHDGPDDPEVTKREVKQWFFKVTDYADELLDATDDLDWTEAVKIAQKNWIGRSKGAEIDFIIDGSEEKIRVFTTRPDTIYGATYLVLAPEHDLVGAITSPDQQRSVQEYQSASAKKTEIERQASKEKTGVFTGAYAINPANGEKIPVWIADYVLAGYGTGAIMAVPAHDERDNEFARKFNLPVVQVVEPVLVQTAGTAAFRESEPVQDSTGIIAIVKHWSEDKYLGLLWPGPGWGTLLTGGVDPGFTPVETVLKEIHEETGYKNANIVRSLGLIHSKYYHEPKAANRFGHAPTFYVELQNDERDEVDQEETAKHELLWLTKEELKTFLTAASHLQALEMLDNPIFVGEGIMANSGAYSGILSSEAREKIVADLAEKGVAEDKTIFKIRDWSVSRQRYWGAPIPIIHCPKCGPVLVPDDQLPVVLPVLEDFAPSGDGRSALGRATDWLKVACPQCGGDGERETDTLDTYICSSWYMMRYFDPGNTEKIFDSETVNKWMPIDFYNGADHATAHMIYARFITRFFHKIGLVTDPEPFKKFLFNGKVTASDGQNFSKTKGNGVDPLDIINDGYGADSLRTYLMFAAPLELWIRWDEQGVPGAYRFIARVWTLVQEFLEAEKKDDGDGEALGRAVHPAIKKVTHDLENQKYNTAIATMMKLCNDLYEAKAKNGFSNRTGWQASLEALVMMMAPFAPHAAEELWHDLGHEDSVHVDHWPQWDEKYLTSDTMTLAVQVNGKVRAEITVSADANEDSVKQAALAEENVRKHLEGRDPKKVIYVPGRLVSIVV